MATALNECCGRGTFDIQNPGEAIGITITAGPLRPTTTFANEDAEKRQEKVIIIIIIITTRYSHQDLTRRKTKYYI